MTKPFLNARWNNLIFISYAVSEATLAPYLPLGLTLDKWEGKAYISIVAFDFSDVHVGGVSVPLLPQLRSFPELNLRFYVRHGDQRGVIFVRELVSNPIVAGLAKLWYHEPYGVVRIGRNTISDGSGGRLEQHTLSSGGVEQKIAVSLPAGPPVAPPEDSFSTWIMEQSWGFGRGNKLTRFRVLHPPWRTLPVSSYECTLDFTHLFGAPWHFLRDRAPDSVLFAEGSQVTVFGSEPVGKSL